MFSVATLFDRRISLFLAPVGYTVSGMQCLCSNLRGFYSMLVRYVCNSDHCLRCQVSGVACVQELLSNAHGIIVPGVCLTELELQISGIVATI